MGSPVGAMRRKVLIAGVSMKTRARRRTPVQGPRGTTRRISRGSTGAGADGASTAACGCGGVSADAEDAGTAMALGMDASANGAAGAGGVVSRWRRCAARRILKKYIAIMITAKSVRRAITSRCDHDRPHGPRLLTGAG